MLSARCVVRATIDLTEIQHSRVTPQSYLGKVATNKTDLVAKRPQEEKRHLGGRVSLQISTCFM